MKKVLERKNKNQYILGAGLVVVGILLSNSNRLAGMLFVGFGLGYNVCLLVQKFSKKK